MFPSGTPDMNSLLEQAAAMQQQLVTAQEELANTRVDGSAGGGLVSATVSGTGELLALTIAPAACDPDDPETLADLVLAAVRDASANAERLAADSMGQLTSGFGEGLPGSGGFGEGLPSSGTAGFEGPTGPAGSTI